MFRVSSSGASPTKVGASHSPQADNAFALRSLIEVRRRTTSHCRFHFHGHGHCHSHYLPHSVSPPLVNLIVTVTVTLTATATVTITPNHT
jgi:hypothetical protein